MPNGSLGTFTIITGDSSGVSADIHDQMPLWLQPGQVDDWMAAEPDDAMAMLLASEPHPHFHGGMPRQPGGEQPLTTTTSSLRSFCGCKGMPLDADGRLIRLLLGVRQGLWTSLDACRHQCGGPTRTRTWNQRIMRHLAFAYKSTG